MIAAINSGLVLSPTLFWLTSAPAATSSLHRIGKAAARGQHQRGVAALRADQFVVEVSAIDAGLAATAAAEPAATATTAAASWRGWGSLAATGSHDLPVASLTVAAGLVTAA